MSYEIELDIFSGRPNPSWILDSASSEELQKRLKSLNQVATPEGIVAPGLGYRGFFVLADDERISVFRRVVIKNKEYFCDENRELERWLVGTGQTIIEKALYDEVLKHIDQ